MKKKGVSLEKTLSTDAPTDIHMKKKAVSSEKTLSTDAPTDIHMKKKGVSQEKTTTLEDSLSALQLTTGTCKYLHVAHKFLYDYFVCFKMIQQRFKSTSTIPELHVEMDLKRVLVRLKCMYCE